MIPPQESRAYRDAGACVSAFGACHRRHDGDNPSGLAAHPLFGGKSAVTDFQSANTWIEHPQCDRALAGPGHRRTRRVDTAIMPRNYATPLTAFVASTALAAGLMLAVPAASPTTAQAASSEPVKVVALGDSVMAGFGYFATSDTGTVLGDNATPPEMSPLDLTNCRPKLHPGGSDGTTSGYNGACSSNVLTSKNTAPLAPNLDWSPDYGYWNQVAWSAQLARALNYPAHSDEVIAANYANFALSGSTALDWADDRVNFKKLPRDGGSDTVYTGVDAVISEQPDIITVTLGANGTLATVLLGEGNICRIRSDKRACFDDLITQEQTLPGLETLYTRLLEGTSGQGTRLMVLLYPSVIPAVTLFTAEQLMIALEVLNDTIATAVRNVQTARPDDAGRIVTVHRKFNTGLPPGDYSAFAPCFGPAALGLVGVDGPSNQSSATQSVFSVTRKLFGWCQGDPWIISGDSGIHPNKRGYRQIAGSAAAVWAALQSQSSATPVITRAAPPNEAFAGQAYTAYQFEATGTPTPVFSVDDEVSLADSDTAAGLPPGMHLTPSGSLGGTPLDVGTYAFRVRASNGLPGGTVLTDVMRIQVKVAPCVTEVSTRSKAPESKVSLRCVTDPATPGSTIVLRGRVTSSPPSVKVRYQVTWEGVSWRTRATTTPTSNGRYRLESRIPVQAPAGRTYRWRVQVIHEGSVIATSRIATSLVASTPG